MPGRAWQHHKALGIGLRVVSVLQRLAETSDAFQEPLGDIVQDGSPPPEEVVCQLGTWLRMSLTPRTPEALRDATERFAMALDGEAFAAVASS